MSAICGVLYLNNAPLCADTLEPVMEALRDYGPDRRATWHRGSIGLGHQMMHVTPESLHEPLPWQHPHLDLSITADARIDNREDLFAALALPHDCRADMPDSQLILFAYEKWGQQCPRYLLGDFAFAIWDGRTQTLFCARDPLGIKPFYYYLSGALFVFASDIRGVLACAGVPRRPNMSFIAAYLYYATFRAHLSETFHQDVRKLPPAQTLTVHAAGARRHVYLDWEAVPPLRLATDADYAELLRDLLSQAVQCRLRSAYPVGAHLSGGLDSSLITVLAARHLREMGQQLTAFSWSPPPTDEDRPFGSKDERRLVEAVARQEDIPIQYTELLEDDVWNWWTQDISTFPMTNTPREPAVRRMAAERHIRVLLSGWGGDQGALPTGHGYLGSLMFRGHWKTVWHELRALSGGNLRRLPKVMKWHLLLPWMPDMLYDRFIPLLRHGWSPILKPAVLESIKRVAPLDKNRYRVYVGTRRHQLYELQKSSYLARIESWTVGGAEQHIEYCYPLLDRRIVEFGLGLPARQTLRNGKMRFFLRQATDGLLPAPLPWEKVGGDPVMLRANHAMSQSVQRAMIHRLAQKDIPCGRLYCLDETQVARFDATFDTSPLWSTYASAARCEYIWQAQAEHFHPIV